MVRRRRGALGRWADSQLAKQKQVERNAERRRQREAVAQLERKADEHTAAVGRREVELQRILIARPHDLRDRRQEVAQTYRRDGVVGMVELVERILQGAGRPERFPQGCEAGYEPEARAFRVRYELPTLFDTVPESVGSRYVKAINDVKPVDRRPAERHAMYRQALGRMTLRALADIFDVTPPDLVDSAAVNGYVTDIDPSTGRRHDFTLISVNTTRRSLDEVNLANPALDPERCLLRLNARISRQPHDLVPVRSVVPWVDLSAHKVVDRDDLAVDGRLDLLDMHHREFEELTRELLEAMGFTAWRTADSHDGGIDVYATAEEDITGMNCVIQVKHYTRLVKPDYVRALHGALEDKNAHKGFLVTTAWFGPESKDYADRNRITLISGRRLRQLLHEHFGLDSVIPLHTLPRGWHPDDIG